VTHRELKIAADGLVLAPFTSPRGYRTQAR